MMPRTLKGEVMDIIINPLSVISRMNLGQIYETELGRILYETSNRVKLLVEKGASRTEIENFIISIYQALDVHADKSYSASVAKTLKTMDNLKFNSYMQDIIKRKIYFFATSFSSPSSKQLEDACKILKIETSEKMILPEMDNLTTANPVTWGISYMQKLEQISEIKYSSRNIGPYVKTTLEPTRGKARAGGQRFGEFDTWAVLAADAKEVLKDMWLINADNPDIKKEVMTSIYQTGSADLETIIQDYDKSGARSMFDVTMICMGLDPSA